MKQLSKIALILATTTAAFGLQAQTGTGAAPAKPAGGMSAPAPAKSGTGEGQVTKVDAAAMTVTFSTGETLKVKDAAVLKGIKEGSKVEFKADMTADGPVITAMKVQS
ncbi:MAG: copper-binding protein [Burkholderiaceae bacterium]